MSGQPVWKKPDTRIGLIDGSVSDGRFPLLDAILFLSLAAENFFDLVEDTTPTEDATAGLERWKCGDYFDGCGFLATDCVTLTANVRNGTSEVESTVSPNARDFEFRALSADGIGASQMTLTITAPL